MSPVAINGVDRQGVYVNGVQVEQALNAANETVEKGVYSATTLSAVDPDLQAANIKLAVDIFGFVGTVAPGGVETIEKYASADIGAGVTYTPSDSGIFFNGGESPSWAIEYYSTADTTWHQPINQDDFNGFTAIGDGTNFRIKNNRGANDTYCLMRHHFSIGTYERARDEDLGAGTAWTPVVAGFFSTASESTNPIQELNTVGGWLPAGPYSITASQPATVIIGDGTNFRIYNAAGSEQYHVTMRAIMI